MDEMELELESIDLNSRPGVSFFEDRLKLYKMKIWERYTCIPTEILLFCSIRGDGI